MILTLRDDQILYILKYDTLVTKVAVTSPKLIMKLGARASVFLFALSLTWLNYWDYSGDAEKKLHMLKLPWHYRIKNLNKSNPLRPKREGMPRDLLYALLYPKVCTTKWYLCSYSTHLARVPNPSMWPFLFSVIVTFQMN